MARSLANLLTESYERGHRGGWRRGAYGVWHMEGSVGGGLASTIT